MPQETLAQRARERWRCLRASQQPQIPKRLPKFPSSTITTTPPQPPRSIPTRLTPVNVHTNHHTSPTWRSHSSKLLAAQLQTVILSIFFMDGNYDRLAIVRKANLMGGILKDHKSRHKKALALTMMCFTFTTCF